MSFTEISDMGQMPVLLFQGPRLSGNTMIDEDDEIDPEGPDESEMDFDEAPDLDICPHCRKMIDEDTEQCPHCGRWISTRAYLSKPAWVVIVALVCVLIMLLYAL